MANSTIVLTARLILAFSTEAVAILYFLMSDQDPVKLGAQNPLLLNICYMQPFYYFITLLAYFIFLCFDKLEETQQSSKQTTRDQYRHVRRLVNFVVTFPLFSWFSVQGFVQKELLSCLPQSDVKNTKKYTCLCELSCVFKHMISLFLTTSYVLLRIRQTINSDDDADISIEDLNWTGALQKTFNKNYMIDFLLPVSSLCLTLLSIMVELQQVINMCLDMDDDEQSHVQQQPEKEKDLFELNFGFQEAIDDSLVEQSLSYVWLILTEATKYFCSLEKLLYFVFFGKLQKLREANKTLVWVCFVTVPFYI